MSAEPTPAAPSAAKPSVERDAVGVAAHASFVIIGALLVFAFAWAVLPAARSQQDAACRGLQPTARSGEAPELELQTLDGQPRKLSDYRGQTVALNFWATWCEPCIGEWPDLDKLARRAKDNPDLRVIAVSIDEKPEAIIPFLEGLSLADTPVEVLWDPTGKAHQSFGSEKIPDTYFVDRLGELRQVFVNVRDWGRPGAYRCLAAHAG